MASAVVNGKGALFVTESVTVGTPPHPTPLQQKALYSVTATINLLTLVSLFFFRIWLSHHH